MALLHPSADVKKRLSAEEELALSTSLRRTERRVEVLCRSVPQAAEILDRRTKRKELTASRHVDRLAEGVRVVRALRPRPDSALEISALWKRTEEERWQLAMSGYRIAVGEARKMGGRGLDHEDLVHEGIVGLLDAAKRFDPARKLRFSTYARWWVRARMMRAIDTTGSTVRLPGGLLEKLRRLEMLKAQLEKAEGAWDMEALAAEIGLSVEEVREVMATNEETQVLPMTSSPPGGQSSDGASRNLEDTLACDRIPSPERTAELTRMHDALRVAVSKLQPRHRHVVSLYLGLDQNNDSRTWTLQSAADQIGISRERVRQLLLWVRNRVAEMLADPEEFVEQEATVPDPESILAVLGKARSSTTTIAKKLYGSTFRRIHVDAIEEALICMERGRLVESYPSERRTLWAMNQA